MEPGGGTEDTTHSALYYNNQGSLNTQIMQYVVRAILKNLTPQEQYANWQWFGQVIIPNWSKCVKNKVQPACFWVFFRYQQS